MAPLGQGTVCCMVVLFWAVMCPRGDAIDLQHATSSGQVASCLLHAAKDALPSSSLPDDTVFIQSSLHVAEFSVEHLQSELDLSEQARQETLSSLTQLDMRIATLKERLRAFNQTSAPTHTDSPSNLWAMLKSSALWLVLAVLIGSMIFMTVTHMRAAHGDDGHVIHDDSHLSHMLVSVALAWLVFGIICFSEFVWFTADNRPLTVIEAAYVITQIVTTVGYGDLTPSTNKGMVFMAFFAVIGVAMVATLLQEVLYKSMQKSQQKLLKEYSSFSGRSREYFIALLPIAGCILFSTLFYSMYEAEKKTVFEAFYMSVISLLTIGFGTYHPITETGRLIAIFWMVVGVGFVGQSIIFFTDSVFHHRARRESHLAAEHIFRNIGDRDGVIDLACFLHYQLTKMGVVNHRISEETLRDIISHFQDYDEDSNGYLDFEEFEECVKTEHTLLPHAHSSSRVMGHAATVR